MTVSTTDDQVRCGGSDRSGALVWAVDDEPAILRAWLRALSDLPIRFRCFENAEETLEAIQVEPPRVLISDHRLPGMEGLDLLQRVGERWPTVRLALHTSDTLAQWRAFQLRVPYLEKTADPKTLRSFVLGLLRP